MSRQKRAKLEMGFDSFLDIVANLVGILIILVVVLGAQSQQVAEQAAIDSVVESEEMRAYEQSLALANTARRAVDELRGETSNYEREIQQRRQERNMLLDLLALAKEQWQTEKAKLSNEQQAASQLAAELAAKERELRELAGERSRFDNAEPELAVLEHLPSPMAKTVFGDEIHLRLRQGKLAVVPIDSLVEEIRIAFRSGVDGTRPGSSTATVGPIRGFIGKYEVQRSRATASRGGSLGTAIRLELTGLTIEPVDESIGEPLLQVLQSNRSMLDIEFAGRPAETTTVTVWVYPDSFKEFRLLKEHLYSRGIATAARPLPEGRQISGGPNGSRSAAQ
ncbi:hypothetical protein SH139x_000667 [Planctomycetaceae bacterium SH139]